MATSRPGLAPADRVGLGLVVRYADCPTVSVSIRIDASRLAVWDLVSDITLPTRFSSELSGVEWLGDEVGPRLGARFAGHSAHEAIGPWSTVSEITRFEPGRVFEWSVVGADGTTSAIWRFTIHGALGGVELEQWFQMGPGRGGLNAAIDRMPDKEARIIARRLSEHRANMERTVEGIKQLAEARTPA